MIKCHETGDGIPFFVVDAKDTVKLRLSDPYIAQSLVRMPCEPVGHRQQTLWESARWNNHADFHTPMMRLPQSDFWINDFIVFKQDRRRMVGRIEQFIRMNERPMVKVRAFLHGGQIPDLNETIQTAFATITYADNEIFHTNNVFTVCITDLLGHVSVTSDHQTEADQTLLKRRYDQQQNNVIDIEEAQLHRLVQPNLMKVEAGGRQALCLPIFFFSDETSGNRTKKYNKFESFSFALAGLPFDTNNKASNLNFMGTSNRASVSDMAPAIAQELSVLENGFFAYDAYWREEIFVFCPILFMCGDNPRQSDLAGHLGSTAKKFCRRCDAEADNSEHLGQPRNKVQTLDIIQSLQNLASTPGISKAELATARRQHGIRESCPSMLRLKTLDMTQHTPVEILHTFLLGIVKYLTKETFSKYMNQAQKDKLNAYLETFDFTSYDRRLLGNFVKHHGSFVGRDFKLLVQFAPILFYHIKVEQQLLDCWITASECSLLLYAKETSPAHCNHLQASLATMLEAILKVFPNYKAKPKLHLLRHLVDDVKSYGPARLFATESFESFNGNIRAAIFLSNRQAPSLDLAQHYASQTSLATLAWGSTFSADAVTNYANANPDFCQVFLDEKRHVEHQPGSLVLAYYTGNSHQPLSYQWANYPERELLQRALLPHNILLVNLQVRPFRGVIDQASKRCGLKSCVSIATERESVHRFYRIHHIVELESQDQDMNTFLKHTGFHYTVLLAPLKIRIHHTGEPNVIQPFNCPRLEELQSFIAVPSTTIVARHHLVHDCEVNGCLPVDNHTNMRIFERRSVQLRQKVWMHKDDKYFFVNPFKFE